MCQKAMYWLNNLDPYGNELSADFGALLKA